MLGKRIGYISPYLPPEIIWACGLIPVRLRPGCCLAAADGYLPRNFSIEARALLAAALEGDLSLDAVVLLDEDDTSRRLWDLWQAYADIPALGLVPLPRLDSGPACRRYAEALGALAGSLAALSGHPLTAEGLGRAIDLYDEQRRLWRVLRRQWISGGLSTGEWHELRWLALTTAPDSANAELASCIGGGSPDTGASQGPRLLVLGSLQVPRQFLTLLEASGARVVAEDSDADERTLTEPIRGRSDGSIRPGQENQSDRLETLGAAYLAKPPGPRPNALPHRLAALTRLLDERGVQGVIALYPKFADAYLAEYIGLAELFRARGLPALLLEDDGESGFSGQQRTRVEAFLEVLA